jgi:hypothetical protein
VRRTRAGDFEIRLPEAERALLRSLVPTLRSALEGDVRADPRLRRLFPPAYAQPEDGEAENEYQALIGDDLVASRRRSLDVLEATAERTRLEEVELAAWLRALNDLRLVLGTRLDVTEDTGPPDPGDPDAPLLAVYDYLGFLLDAVVEALPTGQPEDGS